MSIINPSELDLLEESVITQIKSAIGYKPKAKRTLCALGLKRMNHCVEKTDTPQIRGMIKKIDYLIKVEEV